MNVYNSFLIVLAKAKFIAQLEESTLDVATLTVYFRDYDK